MHSRRAVRLRDGIRSVLTCREVSFNNAFHNLGGTRTLGASLGVIGFVTVCLVDDFLLQNFLDDVLERDYAHCTASLAGRLGNK